MKLLALESGLRRYASHVTPPFWADTQFVFLHDGELSASYYEGDKKSDLLVSFKDGYFIISIPSETTQYGPFTSGSIEVIKNADGTSVGIGLQLELMKRACRFEAAFGSVTLVADSGG